MKNSNKRVARYPIDDLILHRWSPRAMSGELLSHKELMSLFEAARWAPSSYNNQPWRFLYALRDTPSWKLFFDLLDDFNQSWAMHAGVLLVIISGNNFEKTGKPSVTHSFDTGAAWENLALQGFVMGLVVHGMEGFEYNRARSVLEIPEDYTVEAMAAIGKPGKKEDLPKDLQDREKPSSRKEVSEIAFEGKFPR